ncbi:MAG: carboxypeptidase regulatory-like domain-containing protein [Planctomycetota bacterium]|nr:MAG: carboxypeptidase regulatory-like domain-containing protein [Planctomycetota bacterium]
MMHRVVRFSLVLTAVGTLFLAGCGKKGPQLTPVEGVVTLDGQPLEGAMVLFEPQEGGRPATGLTDAQGHFTLKTLEPGDGAQVGVNAVAVTKEKENPNAPPVEEGEIVPIEYATHPLYASPKTSGITVNVQPGMGPVTIELKSSGPQQ